jgi:hypothetical protein
MLVRKKVAVDLSGVATSDAGVALRAKPRSIEKRPQATRAVCAQRSCSR